MSEANAEDGLLGLDEPLAITNDTRHNIEFVFSVFVRPEFRQKKTDGASGGFLPRPIFARAFSHFAPPHCPNTWRAEPRKKNTLSFFRKNSPPAKSEMQGVFFFRGFRRVREAV